MRTLDGAPNPDLIDTKGKSLTRHNQDIPSVQSLSGEGHIAFVKSIFSNIQNRYDFLNHFLSFGRDFVWRRHMVSEMVFNKTGRLLDIATGSGDVALEALKQHRDIHVTGVDFVPQMLLLAKEKIKHNSTVNRIDLSLGDALSLPFENHRFDVATIAFGIRNIPDKAKALQEMARVVVPGGKVLVLEMSYPESKPMWILFSWYVHTLLPALASLFTRHPHAYRYLGDSIQHFPDSDSFLSLMHGVGLESLSYEKFTLGIPKLYVGVKP